jgi:hypothetical protein
MGKGISRVQNCFEPQINPPNTGYLESFQGPSLGMKLHEITDVLLEKNDKD